MSLHHPTQNEVLDKKRAQSMTRTTGADVVTVSRHELERMLKSSPVHNAEDIAAAKRAADAKREQTQAVSQARKDRMLKLEEEGRKHAPLSESDQQKLHANSATRSRADRLLQE